MKKSVKILSLILCCVTVLGIVACTRPGNDNNGTEGTKAPVVTGGDRLDASDGIPDQSFKGWSYKVSCADNKTYEVFSEENEDVVDAAIYDRNLKIEDKYDIEIVPVITTGYAPGAGQLLHEQDIVRWMSAGDTAFDVTLICAWRAGTVIVQNYFYDWNNDVPGVNFEQPWWNSRCNEAFTINGSLYSAVGDLSLSSLEFAYSYLFNKRMAADYKIPDLYETVEEGKWTIDYVLGISKGIYTDVNNDEKKDKGDIYGFAAGTVTNLDAYLPSFGISLTDNKDGEITFPISDSLDKVQSAYEGVYNLFYNNEGAYISMTDEEYSDRFEMFANGQVLLIDAKLKELTEYCRDMTDEYGVLPYPKLNEEQKGYLSNAHDNFSVLCMAYNVENLEMVGKVTESLTCESYRTVFSAYYEKTLKDKVTDAEEDEKILDMIMEGRNYDFSVLFAADTARLYYMLRDTIKEKKNLATHVGDMLETWEMVVEGIVDELEEMKEFE